MPVVVGCEWVGGCVVCLVSTKLLLDDNYQLLFSELVSEKPLNCPNTFGTLVVVGRWVGEWYA